MSRRDRSCPMFSLWRNSWESLCRLQPPEVWSCALTSANSMSQIHDMPKDSGLMTVMTAMVKRSIRDCSTDRRGQDSPSNCVSMIHEPWYFVHYSVSLKFSESVWTKSWSGSRSIWHALSLSLEYGESVKMKLWSESRSVMTLGRKSALMKNRSRNCS
jgi:hypothetical protein